MDGVLGPLLSNSATKESVQVHPKALSLLSAVVYELNRAQSEYEVEHSSTTRWGDMRTVADLAYVGEGKFPLAGDDMRMFVALKTPKAPAAVQLNEPTVESPVHRMVNVPQSKGPTAEAAVKDIVAKGQAPSPRPSPWAPITMNEYFAQEEEAHPVLGQNPLFDPLEFDPVHTDAERSPEATGSGAEPISENSSVRKNRAHCKARSLSFTLPSTYSRSGRRSSFGMDDKTGAGHNGKGEHLRSSRRSSFGMDDKTDAGHNGKGEWNSSVETRATGKLNRWQKAYQLACAKMERGLASQTSSEQNAEQFSATHVPDEGRKGGSDTGGFRTVFLEGNFSRPTTMYNQRCEAQSDDPSWSALDPSDPRKPFKYYATHGRVQGEGGEAGLVDEDSFGHGPAAQFNDSKPLTLGERTLKWTASLRDTRRMSPPSSMASLPSMGELGLRQETQCQIGGTQHLNHTTRPLVKASSRRNSQGVTNNQLLPTAGEPFPALDARKVIDAIDDVWSAWETEDTNPCRQETCGEMLEGCPITLYLEPMPMMNLEFHDPTFEQTAVSNDSHDAAAHKKLLKKSVSELPRVATIATRHRAAMSSSGCAETASNGSKRRSSNSALVPSLRTVQATTFDFGFDAPRASKQQNPTPAPIRSSHHSLSGAPVAMKLALDTLHTVNTSVLESPTSPTAKAGRRFSMPLVGLLSPPAEGRSAPLAPAPPSQITPMTCSTLLGRSAGMTENSVAPHRHHRAMWPSISCNGSIHAVPTDPSNTPSKDLYPDTLETRLGASSIPERSASMRRASFHTFPSSHAHDHTMTSSTDAQQPIPQVLRSSPNLQPTVQRHGSFAQSTEFTRYVSSTLRTTLPQIRAL